MSHARGRAGEALAAAHLEATGWTILHRNFRAGRKEVDLVATREGVVAFVEVKARGGDEYGHPLAAITPAKQREIREVAEAWIERFGAGWTSYRFDAVAIVRERTGAVRIEHVQDAWGY